MSFTDEVVWITGASSGIGEGLAAAFLRDGAWVILSGRRVSELDRVAALAPDRTLVLPFDTTDYAALPELVERAWNWRGRVDRLINNAGISQRSLALDTDLAVYRQLMEVNYVAPVALTRQLLPLMVEQRSGQIAVVSSVAGKVGAPLRSGYCGAKHAVVGYFDALRAEVEEAYGIRVSVILPGSVRTSIAINSLEGNGASRGRSDDNIEHGMAVETVAELILNGLKNNSREIVVAEGIEAMALRLRTQDPEQLFTLTAREGTRLAKLREELGSGVSMDPAKL
ncbi:MULTISPECIES: SDR family NAD(P)-dependent oxidoreductase [Pseudomonas]|uniref:SDR family NAD(P)-dependent oxidoreductase n=2 Tax=Pseudomonas TaxID=286 RepID=A0ABY3PYD9_9PSED|nr:MULTISPECIES: SDR family NAD(P)-dependent oxidoreductase [Pseudomonas]QYY80577.1 SDR family NAD(P)-dependent oxidoreductase [Pseudomonas germanica]UFP98780.1 SDR family NAD(P)-dependent oxidoreductase [Pseudomonas fitomaticsae]